MALIMYCFYFILQYFFSIIFLVVFYNVYKVNL